MAQIINDTGDIKVMNDKGETKWFCKRIVEDKQLMKSMKYEVVNAPDSFPPIENVIDINKLAEHQEQFYKKIENEILEDNIKFEDLKTSKIAEAEKTIEEKLKRNYNRKK